MPENEKIEQEEIKDYKDIKVTEPTYPGTEFIDDKDLLVGVPLIFRALKEMKGKMGNFIVVLAEYENGKMISFSAGGVLQRNIMDHKKQMPFKATITKVQSGNMKSYYTLK